MKESMKFPVWQILILRQPLVVSVLAAVRCAARSGTALGNPPFPELIQLLTRLFIWCFRFFHICTCPENMKVIPANAAHYPAIPAVLPIYRIFLRFPVFLNLLKQSCKKLPEIKIFTT